LAIYSSRRSSSSSRWRAARAPAAAAAAQRRTTPGEQKEGAFPGPTTTRRCSRSFSFAVCADFVLSWCVQDLFDYISMHGALHESSTCRRWFSDIVDTIIAVHRAGVEHRDIKDENFIVDLDTNRLGLIDFGGGSFIGRSAYTEYNGRSPISQLTALDVAQPIVLLRLETGNGCR